MAPTPTATFIRNLNTARSVLLDCFSESSLITDSVDRFRVDFSTLRGYFATLRDKSYFKGRPVLVSPRHLASPGHLSPICSSFRGLLRT
jgi:hypothetical protein